MDESSNNSGTGDGAVECSAENRNNPFLANFEQKQRQRAVSLNIQRKEASSHLVYTAPSSIDNERPPTPRPTPPNSPRRTLAINTSPRQQQQQIPPLKLNEMYKQQQLQQETIIPSNVIVMSASSKSAESEKSVANMSTENSDESKRQCRRATQSLEETETEDEQLLRVLLRQKTEIDGLKTTRREKKKFISDTLKQRVCQTRPSAESLFTSDTESQRLESDDENDDETVFCRTINTPSRGNSRRSSPERRLSETGLQREVNSIRKLIEKQNSDIKQLQMRVTEIIQDQVMKQKESGCIETLCHIL